MRISPILLVIVGLLSGCSLLEVDPSSNSTLELINPLSLFCNFARPLNPEPNPEPNETELDRYFRLAFEEETSGNFQAAISYYEKAANLADCDCDRQHALFGKQAAEEAQQLLETEGIKSRPTQFFWGRLQELTENLPCIEKGEYNDEN
jgi:hypothetical protein